MPTFSHVSPSSPGSDKSAGPSLLAWYVYAVCGVLLPWAFSWLLSGWVLAHHGRKRVGYVGALAAVVLYVASNAILVRSGMVWDQALLVYQGGNVFASLGAWATQRALLGASPRRYALSQWRSWITPVLFGLAVGAGLPVLMELPTLAMGDYSGGDALNREIVLWSVFRNCPTGLLFGALIGAWWAGEGSRFSMSHIAVILAAPLLILCVWTIMSVPVLLSTTQDIDLLRRAALSPDDALVPPWVTGWKYELLHWRRYSLLTFAFMALFVGAPTRIRDFLQRVLVLTPVVFLLHLSMAPLTPVWWEMRQDKLRESLASADAGERAEGYAKVRLMLRRFPHMLRWPVLARRAAIYSYQQGDFETSRELYSQIAERFAHSNKWKYHALQAKQSVENPLFGKTAPYHRLTLPMPDVEEYLTSNWMALLSVIRYWEGPEVSDSEIKIRLKRISLESDRITLQPLPTLVSMENAAADLGYETLFFPPSLDRFRALLDAGFPVLDEFNGAISTLCGYDAARSVLLYHNFRELDEKFRQESRNGAQEILALVDEGLGESRDRLTQIANITADEGGMHWWRDPRVVRYFAPATIVVFPAEKREELARALARPWEELHRESQGYLASLLGWKDVLYADPVRALERAKKAAALFDSPLPLFVAGMVDLTWRRRAYNEFSTIPLAEQLPLLKDLESVFASPENAAFLHKGREALRTRLDELPWAFGNALYRELDADDPADRRIKIRLMQKSVDTFAFWPGLWENLASLHALDKNLSGMIAALEEAISADVLDFRNTLELAALYAQTGNIARVKELLAVVDARAMQDDSNLYFCRAAVAEHEGRENEALALYARAISVKRYRTIYFIQYARLLLKHQKTEQAKKALDWAGRIALDSQYQAEIQELRQQLPSRETSS